ncbi:nicotinamidase-related amidase [Zymomonas mobilis]|uniref:hydrolase n=1 Tax=Zymomonas mobilis TaxID=542 RepID=UPI000B373649|nr:hydrolase [Zymomonas mobilis]ART93717.1 hydrolase [Zymomonas mobilis subsp. mobilis]TWD60438.1 nicotinamidase-related amidase [Zymomonas mobilis]
MLSLNPETTALVLIDLQNGIINLPLEPYNGDKALSVGKTLAEKFRKAGAPVFLVRVTFSENFPDVPPRNVDQPAEYPEGGYSPEWDQLADGLKQSGDMVITKRQWGAFYGTELDLQLRRRGIQTIVLSGIATNFGVESTARQAWEHGYDLVIAEDGCTSFSQALHDMAVQQIFPRLAHVVQSQNIVLK